MKQASILFASLAVALLAACGDSGHDHPHEPDGSHPEPEAQPAAAEEEGHAHGEEPIGTVAIGEHQVELAQGHGAVAAGKEGHLVVKLPYSDKGSTIVRAWIGSEDRTLSYVGKGTYAPDHDDYDVHASAPDPLPAEPMWWIELEQPDGTKLVGSAQPLFE